MPLWMHLSLSSDALERSPGPAPELCSVMYFSESYREIEPSHVPSQLIIDLDFKPHDLEIDASNGNLNFLFDIELQRNSGEIPIGSDMIHVSGGGRKDDFLDDPLAPSKP